MSLRVRQAIRSFTVVSSIGLSVLAITGLLWVINLVMSTWPQWALFVTGFGLIWALVHGFLRVQNPPNHNDEIARWWNN